MAKETFSAIKGTWSRAAHYVAIFIPSFVHFAPTYKKTERFEKIRESGLSTKICFPQDGRDEELHVIEKPILDVYNS